jgi:hypothetical protein
VTVISLPVAAVGKSELLDDFLRKLPKTMKVKASTMNAEMKTMKILRSTTKMKFPTMKVSEFTMKVESAAMKTTVKTMKWR